MNNHFVIIIGSRNNSQWVEMNLDSVLCQDYKNYNIIYFDDASEDGTLNKVQEYREKHSDKLQYLGVTERKYKTWFFSKIETLYDIQDNDILVFLDGDDMLASENVLSYLNEIYSQSNCWMTYGGMRVWNGTDDLKEPYPQNSEIPFEVIKHKAYRKDTWRTSHLKSMRGFLWKSFNKQDLIPNGTPMVGPDDLAIMFAMLELCPPDKVYRITDPVYIYNHSDANQNSRAFKDHKESGIDYEALVRSHPPYDTVSFITPTLAGGLGNQMFEIAAAASLAKDNGAVLIINPKEHILPNQGRNVNNYTSSIFNKITFDPNVSVESIYKHDSNRYKKIPYSPNSKLMGHFQSWRYFDHNRKYIRDLFWNSAEVFELDCHYKMTVDSTAIQVRRGDYKKFPDHHPLLPVEYYYDAVKLTEASQIYIFSDDIDWCKKNLIFNIPVQYITDEDFCELYIIASCKNIIISNSSFGWWAAYLHRMPDAKIIAPSKWFGKAILDEGFNIDDLLMPDWIRI